MSYASQSDLMRIFGEGPFLQHADRDGDGAADADVVAQALEDADAEIDGWLAARYPVPVSPAPARLRTLAADIAWFRLQVGEAGDQSPARMAYLDAVAYLRRIADGTADLPGAGLGTGGPAPAPSASSGARIVHGSRRRFTRDSLRNL